MAANSCRPRRIRGQGRFYLPPQPISAFNRSISACARAR